MQKRYIIDTLTHSLQPETKRGRDIEKNNKRTAGEFLAKVRFVNRKGPPEDHKSEKWHKYDSLYMQAQVKHRGRRGQ